MYIDWGGLVAIEKGHIWIDKYAKLRVNNITYNFAFPKDGTLQVPQRFIFKILNQDPSKIESFLQDGMPTRYPKPRYILRPYQKAAVQALRKKIKYQTKFSNGGILNMSPGSGKTYVALEYIRQMRMYAAIITDRRDYANQWEQEIISYFGKKPKEIDVLVNISVGMGKYDLSNYGVIIIDEIHEYKNNQYLKTFIHASQNIIIGLTGTYTSLCKKLMNIFIGPEIFRYNLTYDNHIHVYSFLYYNPEIHHLRFREDRRVDHAGIRNAIVKDPLRKDIILDILRTLLRFRKKILLTSDRREDLDTILIAARRQNLCDYDEIAVYYSGSTKLSGNEKLILGIDSLCGKSFNVPELDTLFLIYSVTNLEQLIGRIQRKKHNRPVLILDLVEDFSYFHNRHYKFRKEYYKSHKYEITEITHSK